LKPKPSSSPTVLIINQTVGRLFIELVEDISEYLGKCNLITGSSIKTKSRNIIVRQITSYDRRNIFTRVKSWLFFLLGVTREIARSNADTILLAVSNPPILPGLVMLVNIIRKQPYMIIVYDIYPDILVQLKYFTERSLVIRAWRLLNRLIYKRAWKVITIGKHMAATLQQYLSENDASMKLNIIPTWVNTHQFVPRSKKNNPFEIEVGQHEKFIVLYSGNIGFSHDIRILVEAAIQLRTLSTIHFLIIGDGPGKSRLVERSRRENLSNVTFMPFQPEEVFPYSLAMADVAHFHCKRRRTLDDAK